MRKSARSLAAIASVKSSRLLLSADQVSSEQNHAPEITDTQSTPVQDHLVSGRFKGIKRERPSTEQASDTKLLKKTELLKSDHKIESCSETLVDIERLKKYQSLVEEVYLHGSSPKTDSAQSASPRTPNLNHCDAQQLGAFMESFAVAFPSECQDLKVLLDLFQERRYTVIGYAIELFSQLCRSTAICMRISNFFEHLNTKHDKMGLSHVINEMASRFQEVGSKVSVFSSS